MECNICLTEISGHQWGIISINILDSGWVDIENDIITFAVHPYCMSEAVEFYTQDLADGFIENDYIEEAKNAD